MFGENKNEIYTKKFCSWKIKFKKGILKLFLIPKEQVDVPPLKPTNKKTCVLILSK